MIIVVAILHVGTMVADVYVIRRFHIDLKDVKVRGWQGSMTDKLICKICSNEPAKECGKLPPSWKTYSVCACCFPYVLPDEVERDVKGQSKKGRSEVNAMLNKIYARMCKRREYDTFVASLLPTIDGARLLINVMIESAQELNQKVWYKIRPDLDERSGITHYTIMIYREDPNNPQSRRQERNQYEMVGPCN